MDKEHFLKEDEVAGLCSGDEVKRFKNNAGDTIKEPEMKEKEASKEEKASENVKVSEDEKVCGEEKASDEENKEHAEADEAAQSSPKSIFKTNMSLKDFRPDKNIFQVSNEEKKQAKESEFLKMSITKHMVPAKDEINDVLLKGNANLYKYVDEWENIGTGTVYITGDKKKRCFFIRDGVMLAAFDFLVKYDTKPTRRKLSVCIAVREIIEEKAVEQLYCIVFKNGETADEFVDLIKV